ncbi:MAG TPA: hypothetical protein VNA26_08545 [Chitinophagaceae bacterium]|nr:hypothetical protein [Chitinophagaceae bacterium]
MNKTYFFIFITIYFVCSQFTNAQVGAVGTLAGSTQGYLDSTSISAKMNNPSGV